MSCHVVLRNFPTLDYILSFFKIPTTSTAFANLASMAALIVTNVSDVLKLHTQKIDDVAPEQRPMVTTF